MSQVFVIVVVDIAADFHSVQSACQSRGLAEVSSLPRLRMLRGLINEELIQDLSKIPGVHSVERERQIQLLPPNSRIQ
jgi:hypothetical protein